MTAKKIEPALQERQDELTTDQAGGKAALTAAIAHATGQRDDELTELRKARPWGWTNTPGEKQQEALAQIAALVKLREATEAQILTLVRAARTNTGSEWNPTNASWETVGKQLGVTKQSAQSKYGKKL